MPDEFATPVEHEPGRAKRSPIHSNRVGGLNVETLVVADRKMLEKHGRDNVTTYVLTVMNMVRTMSPFLGPAQLSTNAAWLSSTGAQPWNSICYP